MNKPEVASILDFKAYKSYRENNKKICKRDVVKDFVDHGKVISAFYKRASEYLTEGSEGVWIEGLGYFGVINTNQKASEDNRSIIKDEYNWETDGYCFSLMYMPDEKNSIVFRTFVMDYCFAQNVKTRMSKKLKSGFRYNYNGNVFINIDND